MEAKIKRLKQVYACFIDRPLDGVLVVETDDMSTFFVVHAVKELDDRSHEDVQFSIVAPFESLAGFAAEVVAHLERDRTALAAEGAVDPALTAPFPSECHDESVAPLRRIEALIREVHRRVSDPERRITWCLCPAQVHDPGAYAELLAGLLVMPRPHGLRLVLRDVAEAPCIAPGSLDARDESVVRVVFSVSIDEIKAETARKAADERLPLATRLASLVQLAIDDLRTGDLDCADEKFSFIIEHAAGDEEWITPLAWHGRGEIAERKGELTRARRCFEGALSTVQGQKPSALQYNVLFSLGRVCSTLGDHPTAEACFLGASSIGCALGERSATADMLERLGGALLAQGRRNDACNVWSAAADTWREASEPKREDALRRQIEATAAHPSTPSE